MNKTLKIIYFLFYFGTYINSRQNNDIFKEINFLKKEENRIKVQTVQLKNISYNETNKLFFNITDNNKYFINVYSINCYIDIIIHQDDKSGITIFNNMDNDQYSIIISNKENEIFNFTVKPLMDIIDGKSKYNYDNRICPLVINSGKLWDDSKFTMDISEPTVLFFNNDLKQYNISYKINDLDKWNFVAFSFMFNGQKKFYLRIFDNNLKYNEELFQIDNSYIIFLDNNNIKKIIDNNNYINFSINYIETSLKEPIFLVFKPIQKESVSILQKNYINKGFITSSTSYQYYYMKVYKGEEGEIMLHNKITNGKLYGKIIKEKKQGIYYPNKNSENNLLYNEYTLKLKYTFNDTNFCENDCYLLVTYYHEKISIFKDNIGYEFTILVRTWDDIDLIPQLINIPSNEFIFGYFEEESINNHYYSIFIPNGVEEIILQIKGNYFDGFIGVGKKKLITTKRMNNIKNLNITSNKMIIKIILKNLRDFEIDSNNYITFAFRPKDYFVDTLSFYFFRIFFPIYNDNHLILPLDSNIGNICQPEKNNDLEDNFYCYFSLYNNYNEFSLKYSLSSSHQIKDIIITYSYFSNGEFKPENSTQNYFYNENNDNNDNIDFIQFKFEFNDNQIKNILLTFEDGNNEIFPNIYSSQIYHINNFNFFIFI